MKKAMRLHTFLHVSHNDCWMRNFAFYKHHTHAIQRPLIILDFLLCQEAKRDVKSCMHGDLTTDDQQRHFILICFVSAVYCKHVKILLQQFTRSLSDKKNTTDLIIQISFVFVHSVAILHLVNQCLYPNQSSKRIATKFCLEIVYVSSFEHEAKDENIFRFVINIFRHWIWDTKTR